MDYTVSEEDNGVVITRSLTLNQDDDNETASVQVNYQEGNQSSETVENFDDIEEAIRYFDQLEQQDEEDLAELANIATQLDRKGLHKLANKIDVIIVDLVQKDQDTIESVLDSYRKMHGLNKEAKIRTDNSLAKTECPFGLPIPEGCQTVGMGIEVMEPHSSEFEHNKRLYDKFKTNELCPFAVSIIEKNDATDCSYGTTTEGRVTPKLYRSSPIYPKLWQGYNTINLDRNYHQFHDFNYYSIYG